MEELSQAKKWWDTLSSIKQGLLYYMYFPVINGLTTQRWNITDDEILLMYWENKTK